MLAGLAVVLSAGGPSARGGSVLVATRALAAGSLLGAGDLRAMSLRANAEVVGTLIPAGAERGVLGFMLLAPLSAGEPLERSLIGPKQPAAFTLTVGAEDALGGALDPGDRVSVLATFATPNGGEVTRVLAQSLLVLAVGRPPSIGDPSEETVPVTVALHDPAVASQLALANAAAHIDLMRDGAAVGPLPGASAPGVPT